MPQYQGVWTLEQQAQAQSNQQWVTDPNFKNTTLLLQADGTGSGSQNNTFLDGSTNNFFITRNGNTTQGSFSPFSQAPGYWSNYFDGNSFFRTAANPNLAFGTGAITFECWINTLSASNMGMWGSTNEAAWTANSYAFNYYNGAILLWNNTTLWSISVGNLQDGNWHHIAIVRSGTTWQVFADGVSKGTTTTEGTRDLGNNTWRVGVGNTEPSGGATEKFNGYISNMRVSNTALYTANFIPTTSPLTTTSQGVSSSNVKFLSCQSNYFLDNSTNATTFTTNPSYGTPSVQTFGPFAPALQWTPDVVGGSGYFDGSGDYLNLGGQSAFAFGTGDFTIQMWVYSQAAGSGGSQPNVYDGRPAGTPSGNYPTLVIYTSNNICYYVGAGVQITGGTLVLNTWNHIAVARSGTSTKLYLNGVQTGSTWTDTTNYVIGTNRPTVGIDGNTVSGNYFTGYIAGLQVIKGTALYTGSTYTVPTAPPTAVTNTQLLLNYTNAGIYDGTMNTSWETVNSAQVSTSTVKNGSGSIYFNGTASQRLLPSQLYPQLTFGTADFTLECWLYIIGKNASTIAGIIDYRPGVNGTYINWVVDFGAYGGSATAPTLVLYADSATFIRSNVINMGVWNHVALCRANSVTRMFINGILASTPTADTKNYGSGGSAGNYRPTIGCTDGGDSLFGYIDDFRMSRFARYISNFTPPQQALPRQ